MFSSLVRLIQCCNFGEDVVDLRLELGVEHRVSKTKHVVVCHKFAEQLLKQSKNGFQDESPKNKMNTSSQWRWPEVLTSTVIKEMTLQGRLL